MGKMFDPDDVNNPLNATPDFIDNADFEDSEDDIFKDDKDLYLDDIPNTPIVEEEEEETSNHRSFMFDRVDWANEEGDL
jgi:hypothetical protein